MLTKKQIRAIIELILGLGLGVPSIEEIFNGIFIEMFKAGNYMAVMGIVTATFIGIVLTFDAIAVACGFKNLGDLIKYLDDE